MIATLSLAQVYPVDVGLSGLLLVVVLAVGASIGSPGIGIGILSMMLGTVGIPAEGIALIIGVDRMPDMSRTTLNVAGSFFCASGGGRAARRAGAQRNRGGRRSRLATRLTMVRGMTTETMMSANTSVPLHCAIPGSGSGPACGSSPVQTAVTVESEAL